MQSHLVQSKSSKRFLLAVIVINVKQTSSQPLYYKLPTNKSFSQCAAGTSVKEIVMCISIFSKQMSYSVAIREVKCHKNKVRMLNSSMVKCIISLENITMRFVQNNAQKN